MDIVSQGKGTATPAACLRLLRNVGEGVTRQTSIHGRLRVTSSNLQQPLTVPSSKHSMKSFRSHPLVTLELSEDLLARDVSFLTGVALLLGYRGDGISYHHPNQRRLFPLREYTWRLTVIGAENLTRLVNSDETIVPLIQNCTKSFMCGMYDYRNHPRPLQRVNKTLLSCCLP